MIKTVSRDSSRVKQPRRPCWIPLLIMLNMFTASFRGSISISNKVYMGYIFLGTQRNYRTTFVTLHDDLCSILGVQSQLPTDV